MAVLTLDKRQGWRGPEARLDATRAALFRERADALYGAEPLEEGRLYRGLVERVNVSSAIIRVAKRSYQLPLENMTWAFPYSASDATNDKVIAESTEALKRFDV